MSCSQIKGLHASQPGAPGESSLAEHSRSVTPLFHMPLTYERDDHRQLITITVTEPYSVDDIAGAIDRQAAEDTWGYPMLYDLRGVTQVSSEADLQAMADRVKALGAGRERGRVGIVMSPRPALFLVFLTYAHLTRDLGSVEVLLTTAQLDAWLARNARGGAPLPP
jgi:hypothetical protein